MKLLQLVEAAAGGAGRHVLDLTLSLLKRGHELHVAYSPSRVDKTFANELEQLAQFREFRVHEVDLRRAPHWRDFPAMLRLRRYVAQNGPFDLVHCHSTKAGLVGRLALVGYGVKRLYTPHLFYSLEPTRNLLERRIVGAMERALAKCSDGIIVVSREEFEHAVDLGIPQTKLHLIPNGVSLNVNRVSADRATLRHSWGIKEAEVCIGFVGRFVPVKSPETMLRSFAALTSRCEKPTRLAMVGDGPLAPRLRRLSAELGIEDRLVWLGAQDARAIMGAFDVLALTSEAEGHPLVVLEGMACGLPVVATAVGGISDTIQPGVNGFIAPVGGVEEIAAALAVLVESPELRRRMGEASLRLSKNFSVDRMVDQTVALYEQVVSGAWGRRSPADLPAAATR